MGTGGAGREGRAALAAGCEDGAVLSLMRDRRGGPNWVIRGLALVVALLLAGPLTIYLFRAVRAMVAVIL